jgi:hypothetical protein
MSFLSIVKELHDQDTCALLDKMKDKVDSIFLVVLYMSYGVFIGPQSLCFTQNN